MLQHDLFSALSGTPIDDVTAISIVATLGTKGVNFLSCDRGNFAHGENVMSISYMPGKRISPKISQRGYFFAAWEQGKGSNVAWSPAACNAYVLFDFDAIATL